MGMKVFRRSFHTKCVAHEQKHIIYKTFITCTKRSVSVKSTITGTFKTPINIVTRGVSVAVMQSCVFTFIYV